MKNRERKTAPRLGKFWCHSCDMALIYKGQKCPVCKKKDISKRRKK